MVQAIHAVNVYATSLRPGDRLIVRGEIAATVATVTANRDRSAFRIRYRDGAEQVVPWNRRVLIASGSST